METTSSTKTYNKKNSFHNLSATSGLTTVKEQRDRAIRLLESSEPNAEHKEVLEKALTGLKAGAAGESNPIFDITPFVADEMALLEDGRVPYFIFHRYRYEVYPSERKIDHYPPYLQIEPSSICNFRCVFCYQTDKSFSGNKKFMGSMPFELYKKIVDEIEGKIEFISLASRGEPLICKDIGKMLEYSRGKFLNLKMNTNASLLSEKHCHQLLSGAVNTVVFSADAAEEPLYSKLRVNGNLDKVLRNIERFEKIRTTEYKDSKVTTRVSGVLVNEMQNMDKMKSLWGGLVDQISFVKYNPWENVYISPMSDVTTPCSDLWRRMFVWYDGLVNPCDTDYKSDLQVGNVKTDTIKDLWKSDGYKSLRDSHTGGKRSCVGPCNRCVVI